MADFVKINPKKCNRCGLCTILCPSRCLEISRDGVFLTGKNCIECGHCQAVCDHQAISLSSAASFFSYRSFQLDARWLPFGDCDVGTLVRLMHSRRSCRRYERKEVPLGLLEDLISIGASAPSGTNSQAWVFSVLENRAQVVALGQAVAIFYSKMNRMARNPILRMVDRLTGKGNLSDYYKKYYPAVVESLEAWETRGEDRLFHGAPAVITVGVDQHASCPAEDAMLATQNILLAAHAMGLGTCLIGYAVEAVKREMRLRKLLKIGAGESVYAVIALGFPAVQFNRMIIRKQPFVRFPLRKKEQ